MLMSKGIKSKKHIAKITASSICSLLIFLCSLLISSCPNPLINDFVDPKKITFETNGGSHVSTQTIFKGQQISRPKDPTRSGHNFEGWYRDNGTFAAGWDFGAVPSGDMTLYAKWYEIPIGPMLEGTATITGGPFIIGQVLSVDTTSITGSSGSFSFQWRADGVNVGANINTYTIQGTDAGKVITCVVTSSGIAGNVIAVGQEVLFDLSINTAGLTHGDIVSFNNSSVVTGSAALRGNVVPVYCTLTSPGTITNRIALSFVNTPLEMITTTGLSTYNYTVNNNDAINGVIWITPTSTHTDLTPLDPPTNVVFNKNGTITFTEGGNNTSAGATYTYTLFKDGVAHTDLDFVDKPITSGATPANIADKMLDNAGSYTVSVRATTTNPSYDSPSIPVSSNAVTVYSVNIYIVDNTASEAVSVNTIVYATDFTIYVFSGDDVTLTASPDPNRYVRWNSSIGTSNANPYTINNITGNITVTATFDDTSLSINLAPVTTNVTFGSITGSLNAAATIIPNDRTIIYQWYRNTIDSNTGGIFISGNTTAAYAIPASLAVGTYYFYCVVSADGIDASTSNVAAVNVNPISITSVALTVVAPIADQAPSYTASGTGDFSISDVLWFQGETIFSSGTFSGGTVYTVYIELQADANYSFTGLSTATINTVDATRTNNTGTTIEISLDFLAIPSVGQLTTLQGVKDFLNTHPGGNAKEDPIYLQVSLSDEGGLGNMEIVGSGWIQLLEAIDDAGKYVALDLNDCSLAGNEFNPISTFPTGKEYIVSLALPSNATSIIDGTSVNPAFDYFTNMESINGIYIDIIGDNAFCGCTSLKDAIFPLVSSIGESAFNSSGLTEARFPQAISIGESAFSTCTSLTLVAIPAITIIETNTFSGCSSLTSIDFPVVTSIGDMAFWNCSSLDELIFPAAEFIGNNAFDNCTSLFQISFPMATDLGNSVFANTGNHDFIIIFGANAPVLGTSIFSDVTRIVIVSVPTGAAGYGGVPGTYDNLDNTTSNWGNGLRGMGWDGTTDKSGSVMNDITVKTESVIP